MSYYYGRKKHQRTPHQPASPQRAGHYAGLHDESQPSLSGNLTQKQTHGHHRPVQKLNRMEMDEIEAGAERDGNDDVWPPPMPTMHYRYDTAAHQGGNNVRYEYELHPDQIQRYPNVPRRSTRAAITEGQRVTQAPPSPYTEDEEETRTERPKSGHRSRVQTHWLVYVGIGVIIALSLWIGGAWVTAWWTNTQNDWTYTAQFRTFSIDEAVGHNHDSVAHPSHFIVQNDHKHIIVIELPANDFSQSIIYSAPTLIGDGQEKTPVTLSFVFNTQTGREDMVLHVQDQTYIFTNNGSKFVTPQG